MPVVEITHHYDKTPEDIYKISAYIGLGSDILLSHCCLYYLIGNDIRVRLLKCNISSSATGFHFGYALRMLH